MHSVHDELVKSGGNALEAPEIMASTTVTGVIDAPTLF